MGEILVITSGKGGVGKSSIAAHLGAALARRGKSVVLIDADMGLRSLDLLLGLQDKIVYDLADVSDGVCTLKQAVIPAGSKNLSLIAAAQTRDSGALSVNSMRAIAVRLKERFDVVLIDCPAGVGRGFRNAVGAADSALLVSTPDAVALRDAARARGLLLKYDLPEPRLILNRAPMDILFAERAAKEIGIALLGIVPEDQMIPRAVGDTERLIHTPAGEAIGRIADRLNGFTVAIPGTVRVHPLRRAAARFRDWLDGPPMDQ